MSRYLVKFLNRIRPFLSKLGIGKVIPNARDIYDDFMARLWFRKSDENIVEVEGSKMFVDVFHKDPSMRRTFRAYAFNKVHEQETTALFRELVNDGDVVLDLGANIGYFTLLFAQLVGDSGKVYSFEPEPRNFHYLTKNIELNNFKNVHAYQKAVSNQSNKDKLYLCPYDTGHHTLYQNEGISSYRPDHASEEVEFLEVDVVALDQFLDKEASKVHVIKMDVEGSEALALAGMKELLSQAQDIKIILEFFPLLISKMGQSPADVINLLSADYGFKIYAISGEYELQNTHDLESLIEIQSIDDAMKLCPQKDSHLNLFAIKGEQSEEFLQRRN